MSTAQVRVWQARPAVALDGYVYRPKASWTEGASSSCGSRGMPLGSIAGIIDLDAEIAECPCQLANRRAKRETPLH